MEKKYQIQKITVNSETRELQVGWADGHHSRYPMEGLRRACPCVYCQGGHENMGKKVDPEIFLQPSGQNRTISKISQVGNYAVQIIWSDGHQNGIYRFDALRDMCPVENGVL
ncbi:gamma-butyrobetaine hydroxylase-like domain-containing protein [Natronogracilivirga saccharolytica]|uniref:DUF971 domain-containing protein n=1 Tax=Natronogracilivirga saccharolytica TaxID=2812953 RepID=A0A8J7UVL8_9BACT|nr:DUF971 domain-containing protein [Natronogracilivirga saccharolytica]MBP3193595.1 DUF971 domain-containing protein [Natronogracilivirga saccharolytica]